ncbi:haloacid dehalogenase-like hydrolase [bacterium]|nr:haloacid dehalogenase-like hydrolase [bacterium]
MEIFLQNTIAVIFDFDKTLIPGYMQAPLFEHFGVDAEKFWNQVNALPKFYRARGIKMVSEDTMYLNYILNYVREGKFAGLNNELLKKFGSNLSFYSGLPDFFGQLKETVKKQEYEAHEISVEIYIVSTGLLQIINGSTIAKHVDGIWACEFSEDMPKPDFDITKSEQMVIKTKDQEIDHIAYSVDNTTKTRAIFEINKGSNKIDTISVNSNIPQEKRRVPFQNMIYIADGPSDIPVFSVLNQYGGKTYAVYNPSSDKEYNQVYELQKQGRVMMFGEADYSEGKATSRWLKKTVIDIANRIRNSRETALEQNVGKPPTHFTDEKKNSQ